MAPESEKPAAAAPAPATKAAPLVATCHCRSVTVELPAAPTAVNECRCSLCWRYGALWAYYGRGDVLVTVAATVPDSGALNHAGAGRYLRRDDGHAGRLAFHFCAHCGCVTHWWRTAAAAAPGEEKPAADPDKEKMGVNMRLAGEKAVEGVERKVSYE